MEKEMNNENKELLNNLSETDLDYVAKNRPELLTEKQKEIVEQQLSQEQPTNEKVLTLKDNKRRAGYVDVVIVMLTTWISCLCAMAYIYYNIMG